MAQYRPENKAHNYPELSRRISVEEYQEALELARAQGLYRFAR
jgi:putative pyruvate formate lyase activating enzyme